MTRNIPQQFIPCQLTTSNQKQYRQQRAELFDMTDIKFGNYTEKSMYTSQSRNNAQMKRYKYQKLVYQSKPISVSNYNQKMFIIEPMKSQQLQKSQSNIVINSSKIMPMSNSIWVSNSKKMQNRWKCNKNVSIKRQKNRKKEQICLPIAVEKMRQLIFGETNQLQTKTQSTSYYKKRAQKQKKLVLDDEQQINTVDILSIFKVNDIDKDLCPKNNLLNQLQMVDAKPELLFQFYQKDGTNNSTNLIKTNIQYQNPTRSTSYSIKCQTNQGRRASNSKNAYNPLAIFKNNKIKLKEQYHYIFGKISSNFPDEQLQKLRALYYRDFLWKISYNRGFIYQPSNQVYKYYVGKGNNSKLIRRIIAKRKWWVEEQKQQNAHFIWTQLKVYDVYKNQSSHKKQYQFHQKDKIQPVNIDQSVPNLYNQPEILKYLPNDKNSYIFNKEKYQKWRMYMKNRGFIERKPFQNMSQRASMGRPLIKKITHKITNHLEFSRVIGNKKALNRTMQAYFNYKQIDGYLPMTFHITGGLEDEEYFKFLKEFYKKSKDGFNCWIVKPGELSNRGRDIKYCCNLKQIKDQIKQKRTNNNGSSRTYIVQSYIEKPLLYQGRKFDLRHYLMITSTQGKIRGYFYQQGYVRTTSQAYSLQSYQPGVHLTNDAVQKYLPQYGKFQKANKISYNKLNEYMLKIDLKKGFYDIIFPQLRTIGKDIIHAAFPFIDVSRRANNFQIFGIDVMIDQNYKCWLIQVNTNPCIQVNCSVLSAIIPSMLDNALAIGLDSLILPPSGDIKISLNNYVEQNKFELVFDEQTEGYQILSRYNELNIEIGNFGDDDDNYESCEQQNYQE